MDKCYAWKGRFVFAHVKWNVTRVCCKEFPGCWLVIVQCSKTAASKVQFTFGLTGLLFADVCLEADYGYWCSHCSKMRENYLFIIQCKSLLHRGLSMWLLCWVYRLKSNNSPLSSSWSNGFPCLWQTLGRFLHLLQGWCFFRLRFIESIDHCFSLMPFLFSRLSVLSYHTVSHRYTHSHTETL